MTKSTADTTFVLTHEWEYACCGEPWVVGRSYDLGVVPQVGSAWDALLDRPVSLYATHHAVEPGTRRVRVRVLRLWEALRCPAGRGRRGGSIPSPAELAEVEVMEPPRFDPSESPRPEIDDDSASTSAPGLVGWIAEVVVLQELPPDDPGTQASGRPRRKRRR